VTFVDIHAHLDFESILEQKESMLEEMKQKNIIALSNTMNYNNYIQTREHYINSKQVHVLPGLYPTDAGQILDSEFDEYMNFLRNNKDEFIAIGEVGLDAHESKDENILQAQEKRFRQVIEIAIELNKALIIHTRKQEEKALQIIEEYVEKTGFRKFDLHCFTGKKKYFEIIKRLRIYCSIPLIVQNTHSFQLLVESIPIGQLLVETDSPYLHPDKITNTPVQIPKIYETIAKIKGYEPKEVEHIIYKNYMNFIYK
jgi:TatD DNase family protein